MKHFIKWSIYYLFKTRIVYSIWFCLRHLPFKQAIKIPILFMPGSKMKMTGRIEIMAEDIKIGMIILGFKESIFGHIGNKTIYYNEGLIRFRGSEITIASGGNLHVTPSGTLDIGEKVVIGSLVRIYCCKQIVIERGTRIAHECQLFDTGFHYIENTATGDIPAITNPIHIGEWCWIGNRTTINKAKLPPFTIAASGSLLNKDYTEIIPNNSLIGGSPARLIKENCQRVWDQNKERKLFWEIDHVIR